MRCASMNSLKCIQQGLAPSSRMPVSCIEMLLRGKVRLRAPAAVCVGPQQRHGKCDDQVAIANRPTMW